MSLTFDFPQWKIKVEGSQASAEGTSGDAANTSADAKPWEEDLADLDDLSSEDDHTEELTNLQTQGLKDGETDSDVQAAGCSGSPITVAEGRKGAEAAPHCYAPAAAIRGDAIPSEVLLLVLSGLRDVGDCVRASLVCRHWYAVAAQSNELWHVLCTLRLGAGHTDGGGSGGSGGSGPAAAVAAAAVPGAGAYSAPAGGAPGALPAIDTPGSAGVAVDGAAEPSSGPAAAAQGPAAGLPSPVPPAAATGCRRADPGAVLRPPPGCDHPTSRRLNYKTTRALTRIAVRFMVLRKGFEYVVEAAAALWVAAQQQAAAQHQQQQQQQQQSQAGDSGPLTDPGPSRAPAGTATSSCSPGTAPAPTSPFPRPVRRIRHVDQLWESNCRGGSALQVDERFNAVRVQQMVGKLCASEQWALAYEGVAAVMASRCDEVAAVLVAVLQRHQAQQQKRALREQEQQQMQQVQEQQRLQEDARRQHDRPTSGTAHSYRGEGEGPVGKDGASPGAQQQRPTVAWAAGKDEGAGAIAGADGVGGGRLVSFRGDVVYGGSSYADQFAELLRRGDMQGALALSAAAAVREGGAPEGARRALKRRRSGSAGLGIPEEGEDGGWDGGGDGGGGGGEFADEPEMRAVLVMVMAAEGGSYNPMYGTLYDGALASAVVAGDNAGPWRDSMLSPGRQHQPGAVPSHAHAHGNANTQQQQRDAVLPVVSEGLVLWRQLLQSWAVYRRWLEVLTVWCGPLGARVEAERQLAGAAAAPGQAPLALPHLTNKGLQLFRSNVLLAYPLRRPLQAASLWLSARATAEEQLALGPLALGASLGTGWGPDGAATMGAAGGSSSGSASGDRSGCAGGGGGAVAGGGEELCGGPGDEWRLLRAIRKVLTELSVADDATLPACQHTRDKLVRCFGRLLPAGRGGEGPKGGAGAGLLGCMGGPGMKLGAQRGSGGGRGKGMVR